VYTGQIVAAAGPVAGQHRRSAVDTALAGAVTAGRSQHPETDAKSCAPDGSRVLDISRTIASEAAVVNSSA